MKFPQSYRHASAILANPGSTMSEGGTSLWRAVRSRQLIQRHRSVQGSFHPGREQTAGANANRREAGTFNSLGGAVNGQESAFDMLAT